MIGLQSIFIKGAFLIAKKELTEKILKKSISKVDNTEKQDKK